ncbi:MAG: hypothetical protein ACRDYA_07035 [Egibacteraceae bacterium]
MRSQPNLWAGEVVATVGLLVVILGVARSGGRAQRRSWWAPTSAPAFVAFQLLGALLAVGPGARVVPRRGPRRRPSRCSGYSPAEESPS